MLGTSGYSASPPPSTRSGPFVRRSPRHQPQSAVTLDAKRFSLPPSDLMAPPPLVAGAERCKLHVRRGDDSSAAAALGFISLTDWCSQNQGAAQGQQWRKRPRSWSPDASVSPDAQQSPDGPEEAEVRNLKLKALAKDLSRPQSPRGGVSLLSRPASRAASRTPPPPSRSSGNSSRGPFISLKSMLGSSVQGTCASAASLSSSLGSFSLSGPAGSVPRAVCTPPGDAAAFEAHRVHVQCPAPKRPSRLSDPLAAVQTDEAG